MLARKLVDRASLIHGTPGRKAGVWDRRGGEACRLCSGGRFGGCLASWCLREAQTGAQHGRRQDEDESPHRVSLLHAGRGPLCPSDGTPTGKSGGPVERCRARCSEVVKPPILLEMRILSDRAGLRNYAECLQ